jgi:hypothetical protein
VWLVWRVGHGIEECHFALPYAAFYNLLTVKRYLVEPQHRIRLRDLIHQEAERIYQELVSERFSIYVNNSTKEISQQRSRQYKDQTKEVFQQHMRQYESLVERLMAMLAALSYHDTGENAYLLTSCIERLIQSPQHGGMGGLFMLQFYPVLLLTYATGISALAGKRFRNLAAILREPKCRNHRGEKIPAIKKLDIRSVFDLADKWVPYPDAERKRTPVNDYLFDLLRPMLRDYLPGDTEYEETFDIFEYVLSLTYLDITGESWSPMGRFGWRWSEDWERSPITEFISVGLEQGSEWELLKAGFFRGTVGRFNQIEQLQKEHLQNILRQWN